MTARMRAIQVQETGGPEVLRVVEFGAPIPGPGQAVVEEAARLYGHGVDGVYDSVGRDTFARSMDCLRPRGMVVLYGQSSGPVEPLDLQVLARNGSLYLTRPTLGHYVADPAELRRRAGDLFAWILAGALDVRIDRTFPLAEAGDAHRYIEGRRTRGKLLLLLP